MAKFKKIGEIQGYEQDNIKEVVRILEKQGFMLVDGDEDDDDLKTYDILREV